MKNRIFKKILVSLKRILKFGALATSLLISQSCETYFDSAPAVVTIDDGGLISEADVIFGIFPDSENLFYSIVDQNELVLIQDRDQDGSIDGYYVERDEENIFIEVDDNINLPIGASTSAGEVLFFDYNIDLTSVTATLINSNGVTETMENIPLNTIFGKNSKEQINFKQLENDEEDLNEAADRLVKGVEGTLEGVACLRTAFTGSLSLISFLGCTNSFLLVSGTFDDIKIKEQNKPKVAPNSLNTITRDNLILATDVVKCGLEALQRKPPFSCGSTLINETSPVKEAKRDFAKEFLKRVDEYFELEIFYQRKYAGDISFSYIPGPAGDNCTCGQGTASVTIDFGNGLTETLNIGTRRIIILERGNYNITLNYSWGAVDTFNLNVSEYRWQLGPTCTCVFGGPQGS